MGVTIAKADLNREAVGRRAYLAGFEDALERARVRADLVREHEERAASAADVAAFVAVQLRVWVAQWSPEAEVTNEERAYRHGFGDATRALENWPADATDAREQLQHYLATDIVAWVNDRPRDSLALRSMPPRFRRET